MGYNTQRTRMLIGLQASVIVWTVFIQNVPLIKTYLQQIEVIGLPNGPAHAHVTQKSGNAPL